MANFVAFTKDDFEESFLKKFGYIDQSELISVENVGEYVYLYTPKDPKKVGVQIYSSISIYDDQTRGIGEDAIRTVLLDQISKKPIGKESRTHRSLGWQKRLDGKIKSLIEKSREIPRCLKCGSALVQRKGQFGSFWGCLQYPKCNGNPKKTTDQDRIIKVYSDLIPDKIRDFGEIANLAKTNEKQAFLQLIQTTEQLIYKGKLDFALSDNVETKKELNGRVRSLRSTLNGLKSIDNGQIDRFWGILKHGWEKIDPVSVQKAIGSVKIQRVIEVVEPESSNLSTMLEVPLGSDQRVPLVPTKEFKYIDFPFVCFNPPQSEAVQYIDQDCNMVIASPTASGKTAIAEMAMAKTLADSDQAKAVYLAPMKALAEEKLADFTDPKHPFSGLKISVMTGDYEMTEAKKNEVKNASIVLMTNEMLAVRCRMSDSEKSEWIHEIKCLIVDEAHLVGIKGRGDNTEAALMMFTKINPDCRIILLSATMPNVGELGSWIYHLNQKPTKVIRSDYRPCKVEKHFVGIPSTKTYSQDQSKRMESSVNLIKQHPKDSWLVFSGTKTWGWKALGYFRENTNLVVEFINADLKREEKQKLIKDFEQGKINVLIATTVLAYGVNLPARRVIIAHQSFGIDQMPVCDILQMIGRSGRPKYDKQGDAYILVEQKKLKLWQERIEKGENIKSLFGEKDVLEFHAIAEVVNENIQTKLDFYDWYSRSLAAVQKISPASPDQVLDSLWIQNCLYYENRKIKPTMLGKIATWMYYPPRVVFQWSCNVDNWWKDVKTNGSKIRFYGKDYNTSDVAVSLILNYDIDQEGYIPRRDRDLVEQFFSSITVLNYQREILISPSDPTLMNTIATLYQMNEREEKGTLGTLQRQISFDSGRICNAVKMIAERVSKVDLKDELQAAELRIRYGVGEDLISLVQVRGIGKIRAKRLLDQGVKTQTDLADPNNREKVLNILGKKQGEQILGDIDPKAK